MNKIIFNFVNEDASKEFIFEDVKNFTILRNTVFENEANKITDNRWDIKGTKDAVSFNAFINELFNILSEQSISSIVIELNDSITYIDIKDVSKFVYNIFGNMDTTNEEETIYQLSIALK